MTKSVWLLSAVVAVGVMANMSLVETRSSYADVELYINNSPDAYREKAINMARDICNEERLLWEDVTVKDLGAGLWRVTVTSFEQGRTLTVDLNTKDGIVLSKSLK